MTVLPAAAERLAWVNARSAADVPRLVMGSLSRWPLSSSATRPAAAAAAALPPGAAAGAPLPATPHQHQQQQKQQQHRLQHRLFPVGPYRVTYAVDAAARTVVVTGVVSAMRGAVVAAEGGVDPEVAEHRAFVAAFRDEGGARGEGGGTRVKEA